MSLPFQPKHQIRYVHHSEESSIAQTLIAPLRWLFDDNLDITHTERTDGVFGPLFALAGIAYLGCIVGGLMFWFSHVNQLRLALVPFLLGLVLVLIRKQCAAWFHRKSERGTRTRVVVQSPAQVLYDAVAVGVAAFWLFYLGFFLLWLFSNPTALVDLMKIAFVVSGAIGICLLVARILGTGAIRTAPEGILLPVVFATSLKFKLFRRWSELESFKLAEKSALDIPNVIELNFQDGAFCKINTEGLTKLNLQRLILSINAYQPQASSNLDSDRQRCLPAKASAATFTELWYSELKRRFGSTAFVPLESGDTLADGKIKVIGQIACGGFSAIYLAQDDSGRTVVLKESVIPDSANDETRAKIQELFRREATTLSNLSHEQIVAIFDFIVENDRFYLVLEHIEGKTLRQFVVDHGAQREKTVLEWAIQIAGIIDYLHGQNPPVIHRDLSPDNLMLVGEGKIVLIDLGAASHFVGTATGTIIGKKGYMPLEQCCGKTSPQTDVYAFGATLFFLLTGVDPPQSVPESISGYKECMSRSLADVILRCTENEPKNRFASMRDVRAQLVGLQQ